MAPGIIVAASVLRSTLGFTGTSISLYCCCVAWVIVQYCQYCCGVTWVNLQYCRYCCCVTWGILQYCQWCCCVTWGILQYCQYCCCVTWVIQSTTSAIAWREAARLAAAQVDGGNVHCFGLGSNVLEHNVRLGHIHG